ncbi:MAG: lipoyl synthase [Deltaproteobacteria bacterium]|nr:lipoyl synthase [Deltaproteobacteria bacterium]
MTLQLQRKPHWLKVQAPGGANYTFIKQKLREKKLYTVCEEASCPNMGECWKGGTATFMLMGDVCTRGCRFCHVASGKPTALDAEEPQKIASVISELGLTYVVLTSVDRDDLPDGGASHFAKTVAEIKKRNSNIIVESLIPDFQGRAESLKIMSNSGVDVLDHNIETIKRLSERVRDRRCSYGQSLFVLQRLKELNSKIYTKSSLMVGLGETQEEASEVMDDLRTVGVDILTIGQYLRPSHKQLEVKEYVAPAVFEHYRKLGESKGFLYVASGPLVRSSYKAGEFFLEALIRSNNLLAL